MTEILLWAGYFAVFAFLVHKGRSKDAVLSGSVGFGVQAFAYVATYISAVALVGFGGLAHAYGLQMLLVAAGNVWFGTWAVYRFLAWPTRKWQERLGARTPAQLLGLGHGSPSLTRAMAFVFALFLGVYGSAVIKGARSCWPRSSPCPSGRSSGWHRWYSDSKAPPGQTAPCHPAKGSRFPRYRHPPSQSFLFSLPRPRPASWY